MAQTLVAAQRYVSEPKEPFVTSSIATQNIHYRFNVRVALFMAAVAVLSSCSKAALSGKGNKLMAVPVVVTTITPNMGPVAGGTLVTIKGSGFLPGAKVNIGQIACGSVTVTSETLLTCITGAAASGAIDLVEVTTPYGTAWSASGITFSYLDKIKAVATTISSGGVFSTSGTIRVRATIGAVSGIGNTNMATGGVGSNAIIKLGGFQGVIKARNP